MPNDSISKWVQKAKNSEMAAENGSGVKVIRREEPKSRGNIIMDMAEKLRPMLLKLFNGVRDDEGILYQPAHIRGFALNMAQEFLKLHEEKLKNKPNQN